MALAHQQSKSAPAGGQVAQDKSPKPAARKVSGRAVELDPMKLSYRLRDFDQYPVAPLLKKADKRLYAMCKREQEHVRDYADRHVRPFVEKWDEQAGDDHLFVPWSAIDAGIEYQMFSLVVPPVFGGRGVTSVAGAVHAEELAAADAGIFVLFGAHELALASVAASLNPGAILRVMSEIAEAERRGRAVLLALAHTEPTAGSDVEDVDDLKKARLGSRVEKVAGGYKLNARKVFISNGSIARYSIVTAYLDPKRPIETSVELVVPNDAPGFSVGRVEHKMGQRLCPAAELVFEDVFVPEENAIALDDTARMIDTVLSITRGPVGAMSVGIARGCMERTLGYLSQKRVRGHFLFEEQWVQLALADMFGEIQAGRGLYLDAALALDHWGFGKLQRSQRFPVPAVVRRSKLFDSLLSSRRASEGMRKAYANAVSKEDLQRCVAVSSTAKFMCSDGAIRVCMKAMEILGEDATDPQWGVEKCLRDAKLAQIFEGTNQLNRLHVTRGLLKKD